MTTTTKQQKHRLLRLENMLEKCADDMSASDRAFFHQVVCIHAHLDGALVGALCSGRDQKILTRHLEIVSRAGEELKELARRTKLSQASAISEAEKLEEQERLLEDPQGSA